MRCLPRLCHSFVALGLLFALTTIVYAQTENATISGRVTDTSGAVIVGADVQLQSADKGTAVQTTTDNAGIYVFSSVHPGVYHITVKKNGFRTEDLVGLTANVQDHLEHNFRLTLGAVSESVTVTADAVSVNTQDATVSTVVDHKFVESIPLNGRTFQPLIALSPGVVMTNSGNLSEGQFSVNGQRADANYVAVDGVSANIGTSAGSFLGQGASGALPGVSAGGGFNSLVSVDAMQEFKIQTSTYAPEFGRTPGGQISIATRSGSNVLHGTVSEYFRNDVLDANDWVTNHYSLNKPKTRLNDFGGILSGPIVRNRTFFFLSYEGMRVRQPHSTSVEVPSVDARANAPEVMKPYLDAFPIPNGTVYGSGFADFNASYSNASTLNAYSVRLDEIVNDKLTLFARYNNAPSETISRGDSGTTLSDTNRVPFRTQTATVGSSWVVNQRMVNDLRFNYSKSTASNNIELDNFGGATPLSDSALFPSGYSSNTGAYMFLSGTALWAEGRVVANTQRQVNIVDSISISRGPHQLKFGGDYRYLFPINGGSPFSILAMFTGLGVSSSSLGTVYSGHPLLASLAAHDKISIATHNLSLFGQDTWRVNDRLNLTYGLRWEYNPPPTGRNVPLYGLTQVDDMSTVDIAAKGTPLYGTTYNSFAPRVGLAYKLFHSGRGLDTVLRGGWGIFYDLGSSTIGEAMGYFPYGRQKYVYFPSFPLSSSVAVPPALSTSPPYGIVEGVDPKLKIPYTQQWNVAVEQSLGSTQTLTLSYVGAVGRRLLRQEEWYSGDSASTLNNNFTYLKIAKNTATSDYHALQAQFTRRLSRGLQVLASYTWAHSFDIASADSVVDSESFYSPKLDRGPSDFDFRHSFNAAVTYDIPSPFANGAARAMLGNWSVYSTIMARSAEPFTVYKNVSTPYGSFNMRPNLVPGESVWISDSSEAGGKRLNADAFDTSEMALGHQGDLGRNGLRAYGAYQLDAAVQREFSIRERLKLQFKAEFFNFLNHPNFGIPVNDLSEDNFGKVVNTLASQLSPGGTSGGLNSLFQVGSPRSIQFALKLSF
jgi:hypothetical protein